MRIWFVNHYAIPPSLGGGTRHYNLARRLVARGHEVVLVAQSFAHRAKTQIGVEEGEKWKLQEIDSVPFLFLRTPAYSANGADRIKNMLSFAWAVNQEHGLRDLPPPDVVIGSSPSLFAAYAAMRVARRKRVPFAVEIRDIWPQSLVDIGRYTERHPGIRVLGKIEQRLYRDADRVITLLPTSMDHIESRGGSAEKIVWVPNGIALDTVPPVRPPTDDGPFRVVYAGTHNPANAMGTFLDAAAIVDRDKTRGAVEFHFYGEGIEKSRLVERAQREGIGNVRFHASVPKQELYDTLASADVFLAGMPNRPQLYRHGISFNKLFDYFALERPVVMGSCAPRDPVEQSGAGFSVPPEDPEAMAAAIRMLHDMPLAGRIELGRAGRAFVERHHDMDRLAERLEETLASMLAERRDYAPAGA